MNSMIVLRFSSRLLDGRTNNQEYIYTVIANNTIFDVVPEWGDGWCCPDLDEEGYVVKELIDEIVIDFASFRFTLPKSCFSRLPDDFDNDLNSVNSTVNVSLNALKH